MTAPGQLIYNTLDLIDILAQPDAYVQFYVYSHGRWEEASHKLIRGMILGTLEMLCRRGALCWVKVSPE